MDYSNQVESLIEKIAIFAIKSKNLAPKSIMYGVERTRLMEAALELQLFAKSMEMRLGLKIPVSTVDIEDFKRELACLHGNITDLHHQLESDVKYSQGNVPPTNGPLPALLSVQGRVIVSDGVQQRSVPSTPETPANPAQLELSPISPCICPRCSLQIYPASASSGSSTISSFDSGFESASARGFAN